MKSNSNNSILFIGGVVVILAAVVGLLLWNQGGMPGQSGTTKVPHTVLYTIGEVKNFPKTFILDSGVVASGKYTVSSSTNQYNAQWYTTSSMASVINAYKAWFPANGWDLAKETISPPSSAATTTSDVLYATTDAYSMYVDVRSTSKGSSVTVIYRGGR